MEPLIRGLNAGDVPGLLKIMRTLDWLDSDFYQETENAMARVEKLLALAHENNSCLLLGAELGGELIGYIAVYYHPCLILPGPEAYVSELFVREDARGRGAGGALLAEAGKAARGRGCCRLMLLNGREAESYKRGYYARKGWQERPSLANFIYPLANGE